MPSKISVLLVDDHSLVRKGFRRMLEDESDLNVVGEAGSGDDAIKLAKSLKPQVVVMDCALPGTSGLNATKKILEELPDTAVLMLSMHFGRYARQAGARRRRARLRSKKCRRSGTGLRDSQRRRGRTGSRAGTLPRRHAEGRSEIPAHHTRAANSSADCRWKIKQRNRRPLLAQCQHRRGPSRKHHGRARNSQNGGTRRLRDPQRPRKYFLRGGGRRRHRGDRRPRHPGVRFRLKF